MPGKYEKIQELIPLIKQTVENRKRIIAEFSPSRRNDVHPTVKYMVIYRHKEKYSINEKGTLYLSVIRKAKKREKVAAELQLHSDQGFQYTSHEYFELTKLYNITQNKTDPA